MKAVDRAEGKGLSPALRWLFTVLFLVIWAIAVGLTALYYGARIYGYALFFSYLDSPLLLLMNLLPGLLLALLIFALTNRVWPAVLGSGIVIIAGGIAEFFKLQTRSEPLYAGDLRYISEAANISSRYTLTISATMVLCGVTVVAATVLSLLFLKTRFRRWWTRVIFLLLVLGACAGSYFGLYRSEELYARTENLVEVYAVTLSEGSYEMNEWNERDEFCGRGFWYPFLYSTRELGATRPKGYSADEARELLARYAGEDLPADRKVNLISIMLEAYADFSVYPQLEFINDPYETFHALQAEGISGLLDVNIFAGGTIDTERCYMSGAPDMYDYHYPADSFVRWFADQGYRTDFCHPGFKWFYNRENVAANLGFATSHFGEEYFPVAGEDQILMDSEFFPMLVDLLHASAADGEPYFNMSVTYQNHGPYVESFLYDEDRLYVRGDMSEKSSIILNNYFWGIERTDEAIKELTDTLRDDPEPVVLVLFGDHKPWLGDYSSVYFDLGIDLHYWDPATECDYCHVPYLIWANESAKRTLGRDFTGEGGEFSIFYLMLKVFDACGWTGDAYMQALREAYPEIDMISPRLKLYRSNGFLTAFPERLPASAREKMESLRIMSYYRMRDAMR